MKNFKSILFATLTVAIVSCDSNEITQEGTDLIASNSEFITLNSGAIVEKQADNYVWQDDILLSQAQYELLDETGDIIPSEPVEVDTLNMVRVNPITGYNLVPSHFIDTSDMRLRSTAIYPTSYNLWAMVRFTYAKTGTLASSTKSLIQQALAHWEANTNVRFYNATEQPTVDPTYGFAYPYVNFCDGSSNQSYVGRIDGRQDLTLVPGGCSVGTVIHEIGHAIGLLHEQCRYDRDNYITVNTSNIQSSYLSNFTKRTSNYYCIGSFDFNSIMLYSSFTGFEINTSVPAMTKKDGSTFVGQRNGLSGLDRRFPNTVYIPYIARSDVYRELATTVYKPDNTIMTAAERLQLQAELNNGNPNPPANGRIPNNF
ncbi:MAG: M12 family metallopeptidase [Tannerella sp.]|jgi:hypothetical protein|nr:M12 family metallopeptidase [Tannerella sp.]